jgi:hypothetical protein
MTWTGKAKAVYTETKQALQTVFNALNKGQQNKILKNEEVKTLFDRYGVVTEQEE